MPTKKEAIKDLERNRLSNQQSLVNKIEGVPSSKNIKRYIPAGKTLTDIPRERFPSAINQWLKHCTHFSEMEISFLDPKPTVVSETKVYDFNSKSPNNEWEVRGKRWLSEILSKSLLKESVAFIKVKKEGIYTYSTEETPCPGMEEWAPYISFVSSRGGR